MRPRYNAKQFIDAIKNSGGIISTIAERVGCNWYTARKWIQTVPTVKRAYESECERINDMAQSILLKSIREGNTADARWWLARKRRAEFGDVVDITTAGKPITTEQIVVYAKMLGAVVREYIDDPETLKQIYSAFEERVKLLVSEGAGGGDASAGEDHF